MKVRIHLISLIYCVCRQAERSTDFTLASPHGLDEMRDYFRHGNRMRILEDAISILGRDAVPPQNTHPLKDAALRWILLLPGMIGGWRWVSRRQLESGESSLISFREMARSGSPAPVNELIALRMRLYGFQLCLRGGTLIAGRLEKLAQSAEHYGQNDRMEFSNIGDLLKIGKPSS